MVSSTSNPYSVRKHPMQQQLAFRGLIRPGGHSTTNTSQFTTTNNNTNSMGIRSQLRNGSVKACKKRATRAKYKSPALVQRSVKGGVGFVADVHCKVCKATRLNLQGKNVSIPHRPHDRRCPKNRKTGGLSEFTVFVEKVAAENVRINNARIGQYPEVDEQTRRQFGSVSSHFSAAASAQKKITGMSDMSTQMLICQPVMPSNNKSGKGTSNKADSINIREVLDSGIGELERKENY
jgi:hypothetical protein